MNYICRTGSEIRKYELLHRKAYPYSYISESEYSIIIKKLNKPVLKKLIPYINAGFFNCHSYTRLNDISISNEAREVISFLYPTKNLEENLKKYGFNLKINMSGFPSVVYENESTFNPWSNIVPVYPEHKNMWFNVPMTLCNNVNMDKLIYYLHTYGDPALVKVVDKEKQHKLIKKLYIYNYLVNKK